ncbi:MAG: alpha/beta hydrolase, partial [Acidimicrobiales bacterium]
MRASRVLVGAAVVGAASTAAVLVAERRLLRHMDVTAPPPGWTRPRFPDGTDVMVPTDDGAQLAVRIAEPEAEAGGTTDRDPVPTVVMVHGLTSNYHDWGPVAGRLVQKGHRVIGINQRGHGGSTVGSEGFSATRLG